MQRLIVDGYNVIHAWRPLKQSLVRDGLEEARRWLLRTLAEYRALRGVTVDVVFDGRASGRSVEAPEVIDGVTVHFSAKSESADNVIERTCFEARERGRVEGVTVVTSDRLQRDLVRAMGVDSMSAGQLEAEVSAALAEVGETLSRLSGAAPFPRRLEHRIDPGVRARLERMRRGETDGEDGEADARV